MNVNNGSTQKNDYPVTVHKRASRYVLGIIVSLVLLLIIWGICKIAGSFVKVGEITVEGSSPYSREQITDASGIKPGIKKNKLDTDTAESEILRRLPCISDVRVRKKINGNILIEVTSEKSGYITVIANDYFVMSDSFRILGIPGNVATDENIPLIKFPKVKRGIIGQKVEFYQNGDYINDFISVLRKTKFADDIKVIDVSDKYRLQINIENKFDIIFGDQKNIDSKLNIIYSMLEDDSLKNAGKAILDVSDLSSPTIRIIA